MDIKFTDHAQYRFYKRGITVSEIKEMITIPDSVKYQDDGKIVAKKIVNGVSKTVVYRKIRNRYIIITIYENDV